MGVYVKGKEMPKTCCACFCARDNKCGITRYEPTFAEWYEDGVKDCPLVPVPPHGDLIDRDALIKDGWLNLHKEVMRMGGYAIHELPLKNPSIPVIIEAEEGEA